MKIILLLDLKIVVALTQDILLSRGSLFFFFISFRGNFNIIPTNYCELNGGRPTLFSFI